MGVIVMYVRQTCGWVTLITCWFASSSENQLSAKRKPTIR